MKEEREKKGSREKNEEGREPRKKDMRGENQRESEKTHGQNWRRKKTSEGKSFCLNTDTTERENKSLDAGIQTYPAISSHVLETNLILHLLAMQERQEGRERMNSHFV